MDMGLNSQEVKELMDYIAENNSWNNPLTAAQRNRKIIKYYSMTVDTRTNTVWKVDFWGVSNSNCSEKKVTTFRDEPTAIQPLTLKERIYQWLDEEKEN